MTVDLPRFGLNLRVKRTGRPTRASSRHPDVEWEGDPKIAADVGAGLPLRQPDKSLKPCADLAVGGGNCSGESVDFGLILEAANPSGAAWQTGCPKRWCLYYSTGKRVFFARDFPKTLMILEIKSLEGVVCVSVCALACVRAREVEEKDGEAPHRRHPNPYAHCAMAQRRIRRNGQAA